VDPSPKNRMHINIEPPLKPEIFYKPLLYCGRLKFTLLAVTTMLVQNVFSREISDLKSCCIK
jgi:hypothetical protein